MKPPSDIKPDFAALLALAESKFNAWFVKVGLPERERREKELIGQKLTIGPWAFHTIRIYREQLECEVRERIGLYAAVAHASANEEMVSERRLDEYRDLVMTTVQHVTTSLRDQIERTWRAVGDLPESQMPHEVRYQQLQSDILDIVNAELRVLKAEGRLGITAEFLAKVREHNSHVVAESRDQASPEAGATIGSGRAQTSSELSPRELIERYKANRFPSFEVMADRIGMCRDTLLAIKNEKRWALDSTYQLLAEVIGDDCKPEHLHPRKVRRRIRPKAV